MVAPYIHRDTRYASGVPFESELLTESNHRIANHLSLLAGLVQMHASAVAKGPQVFDRLQVRAMLQETAGKIVSVGHFHRKLAHRIDAGELGLASYLIGYFNDLVWSLSIDGQISVVERLESGCNVSPECAQTLMLIVGEIAMNALKHAHPAGLPTCISLSCTHSGDAVIVEVADDGVGLPEAFDVQCDGGLGLQLIRSLSAKLNAELQIESDCLGLTFRLRLPKS